MFCQAVSDDIYPKPLLSDSFCIPEHSVFVSASAMSFVGPSPQTPLEVKQDSGSQSADAGAMMDTTLAPSVDKPTATSAGGTASSESTGVKRKAEDDKESSEYVGEAMPVDQATSSVIGFATQASPQSVMGSDEPVWFNWPIPRITTEEWSQGLLTDEQPVHDLVQSVREGCLHISSENLVTILFYSHENGFGMYRKYAMMNPYF